MKEIGVMFSAAMVRAVDQDRKTQTRRLASSPLAKLRPGTILWVRETWRTMALHDALKPVQLGEKYQASIYGAAREAPILYEADQSRRGRWADDETEGWSPGKCRPAIHMPRFAARIGLRLVDVREEPVQEISWGDAVAEGIVERKKDGPLSTWGLAEWRNEDCRYHPGNAYAALWKSLHHKEGERWDDNPRVVVLAFEKAWVDK